MALTFNQALSTTLSILNTRVTDDYNGTRQGSFFFSGDHIVDNFDRYMPKGQVQEDEDVTDNQSFGIPFENDEFYRLNIRFHVKHGDIGSRSGLKNRAACLYYVKQIKNAINTYQGSYGGCVVTFDTVSQPLYIPESQRYLVTIPLIIQTRQTI